MGVIALGIGFGTPLALAGVALHIAGHAVAKALGFYAATPLLGHEPRAAAHGVTGIARTDRRLGAAIGHLARGARGLPPSPLFVSEVLILAGGFQAGRLGRRQRRGAARARLPRPDALADRDRPRARRTAAAASPSPACAAIGVARPPSRSSCSARSPPPRSGCPDRRLVAALVKGLVLMDAACALPQPRSRRRSAPAGASRGLHATDERSRRPHAARRPGRVDQARDGRTVDSTDAPSIVDLAPAAGWDEREAHDLYGVDFAGHEPLRPLVDHDPSLDALDGAGPRPRSLPGRGRPDPRRRDRVRPLPLPRRRRPHPPPRRAALLQAPRTRTGRRRAARSPTGIAYVGARLRRLRGREHRRLRARLRGGARARRRPPELARARTILLELERIWNHLNDIAAICAGVGPRRRQQPLRGPHRARPAPERAPHRPPLPVRRRPGRRQRRSSSGTTRCGRRARNSRRSARRRRAAGGRCSSTSPSRTACRRSAIVDSRGRAPARDGRARGARQRRPRRRARRPPARLAYDGFEAVLPDEPGRRRPRPARAAHARARAVVRAARQRCSSRPGRLPASTTAATTGGRSGSDASRAPAARRPASSSAVGDRIAPAAPPHRLLRQLAVGRPRRRRQPAARLPPDQQELRALLRLRRPLMLTLLRDLRQLRRRHRPARRPTAVAASRSATSTPAPATAASTSSPSSPSPYYDLERFGLGIVASPRHADLLLVTGAVTTRMREPLLAAYHAMPEPRRVAALGNCALGCNVLGTEQNLVGPVDGRSSRSTSASPAARRRRRRSPRRCSGSIDGKPAAS